MPRVLGGGALTLLISVSFLNAATPESDAFWFLLVPIGLSAVTMPRRWLAVVTALGFASYVVMTWFGRGSCSALPAPGWSPWRCSPGPWRS